MLTRYGKAFALGLALLVFIGLVSGYRELLIIAVSWAVVGVVAVGWSFARPRLSAEREIRPNRVVEGQPATALLTVTNISSRRSPSLVAVERFGDALVPIAVPSLASRGSHSRPYRLPTSRRGVFSVGPLTVSRADPFQLIRTGQSERSTETLWVHPSTHDMAPFPNGRTRDLEGRTSGEAPQGGVAFHTLRDYVVGDDLRLIHWRSSARTGKLVVRHNVDTFQPRTLVLLDTSSAVYGTGDGFEEVVRVAASLSLASLRSHYPMRLRTSGGTLVVSEMSTSPEQVLDQLSALETSATDSLSSVTRQATREPGGYSLVVLTGPASARELAVIGSLRTRFQNITIGRIGVAGSGSVHELPGAVLINAATSAEFASIWNRRVRR